MGYGLRAVLGSTLFVDCFLNILPGDKSKTGAPVSVGLYEYLERYNVNCKTRKTERQKAGR